MTGARSRTWLLGIAVAAVYFVAILATVGVGGTGVRPLYDALTPPARYRWANPPRLFKAGNVKPTSISEQVSPLGAASPATSVATSDGQIIVNLSGGAVPAHDGDTSATITLTQTDPGTLGPLPAGHYPYGNAYRITATAKPSGASLPAFTSPADLIIDTPAVGDAMYTSPDGHTWTAIQAHFFPPTNLYAGSSITATGYYVAAGTVPVAGKASPSTSSSGNALLIGLIVGVVAVVLLVAAYAVSRS